MLSPSASDIATSKAPRKVHVETWGCQMNNADSERMLALLAERNYVATPTAEDADLILLNTCHIREKARHKVVSRLGVLRELKEHRPGLRIAVAGCVAQAEGAKLLKAAPGIIDVLLGPGRIEALPELLDEQARTGRAAVARGFQRHEPHEPGATLPARPAAAPTLSGAPEISRFVNIQQGCDNYCTFCVVPFTRGRETSRTAAEILAESRALLASGVKELTLLGQNVNSYGADLVATGLSPQTADGPFVELLRQVAALPELLRLRFTTSNPHDFSPALAALFASHDKLGRYLHLPLQSGDDEVLARMQRKVTADAYWQRVQDLRQRVPDMALSTDLIVGFPGETDAQFERTLAMVRAVEFSFAFTFKYSPRPHTPAARYSDQVPEAVKDARLARLNALQDELTTAQQLAEIGETRSVLFHYESRKQPGYYYGRTPHFRLVRVLSAVNLIGQELPVRITAGNKTALLGELA